jgi:hypothetical protein
MPGERHPRSRARFGARTNLPMATRSGSVTRPPVSPTSDAPRLPDVVRCGVTHTSVTTGAQPQLGRCLAPVEDDGETLRPKSP